MKWNWKEWLDAIGATAGIGALWMHFKEWARETAKHPEIQAKLVKKLTEDERGENMKIVIAKMPHDWRHQRFMHRLAQAQKLGLEHSFMIGLNKLKLDEMQENEAVEILQELGQMEDTEFWAYMDSLHDDRYSQFFTRLILGTAEVVRRTAPIAISAIIPVIQQARAEAHSLAGWLRQQRGK